MSDTTGTAPSAPADAAAPAEGKTESTGNHLNADPGTAIADAAKEAMRKYKVKVDGQELEVDEKELLRGYSHQRAANKILQEGKAAKKQVEEFITLMKDKQKLFDVIQRLGHDPRKLTEEYLASQLEEEMMDPREKEFRRAQKELEKYKEMERLQKEEQERTVHEQLKSKFMEDYSKTFVQALEQTGVPPTKAIVAEMAKYVHRAAGIGFQMTAHEAAQLVKEDIQRANAALYKNADVETLIKMLGNDTAEELANKIRKYDTSRVKNPEQNLKTPTEQSLEPRKKRGTNAPMSLKDWRSYNRK